MDELILDTVVEEDPTLDEALNMLKYWQDKLQLGYWEFKLNIVDKSVIDYNGNCNFNCVKRQASINILQAKDRTPISGFHTTFEFILVHELIHILLGLALIDTEDNNLADTTVEHVVSALSTIVIKLDKNPTSKSKYPIPSYFVPHDSFPNVDSFNPSKLKVNYEDLDTNLSNNTRCIPEGMPCNGNVHKCVYHFQNRFYPPCLDCEPFKCPKQLLDKHNKTLCGTSS